MNCISEKTPSSSFGAVPCLHAKLWALSLAPTWSIASRSQRLSSGRKVPTRTSDGLHTAPHHQPRKPLGCLRLHGKCQELVGSQSPVQYAIETIPPSKTVEKPSFQVHTVRQTCVCEYHRFTVRQVRCVSMLFVVSCLSSCLSVCSQSVGVSRSLFPASLFRTSIDGQGDAPTDTGLHTVAQSVLSRSYGLVVTACKSSPRDSAVTIGSHMQQNAPTSGLSCPRRLSFPQELTSQMWRALSSVSVCVRASTRVLRSDGRRAKKRKSAFGF